VFDGDWKSLGISNWQPTLCRAEAVAASLVINNRVANGRPGVVAAGQASAESGDFDTPEQRIQFRS